MRVLPVVALLPLLAWSVASGAAPAGPAPALSLGAVAPVASAGSRYVSCPDPIAVDWAHPRTMLTSSAATVRRFRARQQGGRTSTVTVASARPGGYRLVARGAATVGGTATPAEVMSTSGRSMVVGVNGGYFWRGTPGQEWSKGAQVRGGTVAYLPAGPHRYVGADTTGAISKGWARVRGSVLTRATPTGRVTSLPVVAVNAPAAGNGVAVYTRAWSSAQRRSGGSWEVLVRGGLVVAAGPSVRAVLAGSPVAEHRFVVRASGTAATALRRVRVVHRMSYSARAVDETGRTLADTTVGGTTLLVKGKVWIGCSRVALRPRTMVAWSTRTGGLWLVTASGDADGPRSSAYVGASHHQMALVAQQLGATDAVLVDGGGSTMMVLRTPTGLRRVDGPFVTQRPVADVLGIVAR